jgi:hypothetical protein
MVRLNGMGQPGKIRVWVEQLAACWGPLSSSSSFFFFLHTSFGGNLFFFKSKLHCKNWQRKQNSPIRFNETQPTSICLSQLLYS